MIEPRLSEADPMVTALRGVSREQYGADYLTHALEVYKLYVEMADRISGRREKTNSFFLAVNAAVLALLAKDALNGGEVSRLLQLLVPLSGSLLCFLWYRIVRSYRDLNTAKFKVVHAMESYLPLRPYDAEWASVGRGNVGQKYLPFTYVEAAVPWLFFLLYGILAASNVPWSGMVTAIWPTG